MNIETIDELANSIADMCNIYDSYITESLYEQHPTNCNCRVCFVIYMKDRIQKVFENEKLLENYEKKS